MRKLGISIYPEKTTEEKLINYIDKAYSAGFSRIFSCLLSSAQNKGIEDKEIILKKFKIMDITLIIFISVYLSNKKNLEQRKMINYDI